MAREFFDYDPLTGVTHYTEQQGDTTIVYTEQDLTPLIERNKKIANLGLKDKGIKEGWFHYCDIPPVVELALRKKGINIHDPSHGKAMFKEINANYPYLKLTHKHHVGN
jgi:hypothetical protein